MKPSISHGESVRFLCACLSPANNSEGLKDRLPCEKQWLKIIALSNYFLLTPALFVSLRDKGLLDKVDAKLAGFLCEVHRHNDIRNQKLLQQMHSVSSMLNRQNIRPVLLKGIGSLAENLFSDQGCRSMLDIDFLVADDELDAADEVIKSAGYFNADVPSEPSDKHLPRLYHDDELAALEIHHKLLSKTGGALLKSSSLIDHSVNISLWGESVAVQVLCVEHQIMHNILHCQLDNKCFDYCQLDLRQMHHFAILTYKYRHQIDWKFIEDGMEGYGDVYQAYLESVNSLFFLDNPITDEGFNASKFLDRALSRTGVRLGWFESLRSEFSPGRVRRLYGAMTLFGVIWCTVKHVAKMVNVHIIQGGFKERMKRSARYRKIDAIEKN